MRVIVDTHAHVFPPSVIAQRAEYAARDAGFARLYGDPAARMATADDLLASMDAAGIDVSVAANFAWSDPSLCRMTNDYLCDAAARSGGRLVAFGMVQPASPEAALAEVDRLRAGGAAGIGELRPDDQGYSLDAAPVREVLAAAGDAGLALMFHLSEPVGHRYPGKEGLALEPFVRFAIDHPGVRLIAAHWGGGLPFYVLMPEVKAALANTWFDSAATTLLYDAGVFGAVASLCGAGRILFGSDYPLLSQARQRAVAEASGLSAEELRLVLGENARRLLGLRIDAIKAEEGHG